MKKITALLLLVTQYAVYAQPVSPDRKFSPAELKADLNYLQQQLYNVQAYPYTELNKGQYDALFSGIEAKLTDSLPATSFLKLIKPAIAHLCDEHAQAYIPDKLLPKNYRDDAIYLPLTLTKQGKNYYADQILSTQGNLQKGDIIKEVNGVPIGDLLKQCALFTSGYPDQRLEKAAAQFGFLYTWTLANPHSAYIIKTGGNKTITQPGVTLKVWKDELNRQTGWNSGCAEAISYQKIGEAGYVNACSFNIPPRQIDSIRARIAAIYEQIKKDGPKYLFIDISKNSGGQSVVGNMLIDGFNDKPFRGYMSNFKKSTDYVKLLKSWGIEADDYYKNAPEGKVFHFDPDTTFPPEHNPNRFTGKVFIIVGNGTFSSAMMMATWVKDNHLATIAGETPRLGHPNGFGEMYNTKLPNTGIVILFGVKQWIRPSGDLKDNLLLPDIAIELNEDKAALVKNVLKQAGEQ